MTDSSTSRPGSSASSATPAPIRRRNSTRTRRRSSPITATTATCAQTSACPELKEVARFGGQEDALGRAAGSDHRGARYKVGSFDVAGNTVVKSEFLSRCSRWRRRVLRREAHPQGAREGAGDLRRRRLLRVHRLPRLQVPRRSEPERARGAGLAQSARGTAGQRHHADRRRDDADAGRAAVLRQPHHLHRQHHDARQRDPARDAAARERRVQHRGAEVQRQAAQSARLLQGARRQAGRGRRPEDAERDQQSRREAEAGRAEPQPAHLRRRRVGVRGLLRPVVVPDRRTSSAAARA